MEGFCNVEVNELGPVHAYVVLPPIFADKFNVAPSQTALLLLGDGVAGVGLIVI